MSIPARPYQRQHWLVNPALQFRFIRVMLFVLLLMAVVAVLGMYLALWFTLYSFELLQDTYLVALFKTVAWTVVLEFIVLVPIVSWFGVRVTHTVAGPLVRIRAALADMAQGKFEINIRLRKGDALTELAEDINQLAESLRHRSTP